MFHSLSAWSEHSVADDASAPILALAAASLAGFSRIYSFCNVNYIYTVRYAETKWPEYVDL